MSRRVIAAICILLGVGLVHLLAQDKKGKGKPKKPETQQAEPADSTGDEQAVDIVQHSADSSTATRYFLFPDFYSYWPADNNDTILKYECFDINHYPIIMDTLTDANDIQFINYTKTYNDYLKTYIDAEGKPRPQPISRTLVTYERTGNDTWLRRDVITGVSYSLKEQHDRIVKKDTTIVADPITGTRHTTIRKYYKTTEIDGSEALDREEKNLRVEEDGTVGSNYKAMKHINADKPTTAIRYYTVPEFYFHWPKRSRDTLFEFECYDDRDSVIPEVTNYDSVHYYSLLKKFIDSTHTYRDNDGKQKPLPVSLIVQRYDAKGKDKWISIEYPKNRFTDLKGFKDNIIRVDTEAVVDPITGDEFLRIYRHFKVIKN